MEDICFCVLQPSEFFNIYQQVQLLWKSEKTKYHATFKSKAVTVAPEHAGSEAMTPRHCKELLQLVTPFTSVRYTRQGSKTVGFGLHFLENVTKRLLYEIKMNSFSAGLEIEVIGRVKSICSIYKKMQKKRIPIEEVYDLLALRVIVKEEGDADIALEVCYKILEVVQHLWKQIPSELDDYIVVPKQSGYQSLHVAVKGPGGIPFEVQIRTASMDESAEYGHAAHWCYKEDSDALTSESDPLTIRDSIWGKKSTIKGHPVVRIRDGAWRDGIVIRTEDEGLGIIVAVNISERMSRSYGSYTFAVRQTYEALLQYVKEKKYSRPGSGDFHAAVERYVLCSDHAYHLMDVFGHKHPTIVRPLKVFESDHSLATHLESLDSGRRGNATELTEDDVEMKNRSSHLRSMLEEPNGLNLLEGPETSTVHIFVFPGGKMHSFPHGSTAADVLAVHHPQLHHPGQFANVNDRIVPAETLLKNGDFIKLQDVRKQ